MAIGTIIALALIVCAFVLVLGLIFALLIDASIIPGLFIAGLCIFVAMLVALPFMRIPA